LRTGRDAESRNSISFCSLRPSLRLARRLGGYRRPTAKLGPKPPGSDPWFRPRVPRWSCTQFTRTDYSLNLSFRELGRHRRVASARLFDSDGGSGATVGVLHPGCTRTPTGLGTRPGRIRAGSAPRYRTRLWYSATALGCGTRLWHTAVALGCGHSASMGRFFGSCPKRLRRVSVHTPQWVALNGKHCDPSHPLSAYGSVRGRGTGLLRPQCGYRRATPSWKWACAYRACAPCPAALQGCLRDNGWDVARQPMKTFGTVAGGVHWTDGT